MEEMPNFTQKHRKFLKEIISNCSTMLLVVKLWRMLENTLKLRLQQLIDK